MALLRLAAIALRPRPSWRIALTMIAAVMLAGCGHSRQSYRPVYTTPAPVSAPCTNCGSGTTVTTEEPERPRPARSHRCPSYPSSDVTRRIGDRPGSAGRRTDPQLDGGVSAQVATRRRTRLRRNSGSACAETGDGTTPPPPPKPVRRWCRPSSSRARTHPCRPPR